VQAIEDDGGWGRSREHVLPRSLVRSRLISAAAANGRPSRCMTW